MRPSVKVVAEDGEEKEVRLLEGKYMEGKSATLALALTYSTGEKMIAMDAEFVKAILKDINDLNQLIHPPLAK